MNILVTGGTGYIGRRVVDNLKTRHQLFILTRNKNYKIDNSVRVIYGDIAKVLKLKEFTAGFNFDVVIHLAAYHPRNPYESFEKSIFYNVLGTQNLLAMARIWNFKQFIFASTFTVYGKGSQNKISESFVTNPVNPDAISKYFAEKTLEHFYHHVGINTTILRVGGVFGEDRQDGAVYNFVRGAMLGKRINVVNPFNATDMVYVQDVARAICNSIDALGFEIINIGSGEHRTVFELAKLIKELGHSDSKINVHSQDPHDSMTIVLDIEKARNLIGFRPTGNVAVFKKMIGEFAK